MNFEEILWTESFKEWNFFYDLHEKDLFNKEAYLDLIKNIRLYKESIKNSLFINKDIISTIYIWMNIFWWINNMFYDKKIIVKWIQNWDEFNDYLDELNFEVMQLMRIEKR